MEWNWSIVDAIVVVVCCLLPAASAWRASVKVKDNEIPYKDQRYGNLLDAKDTERYENLLDAKDTKTFWIQFTQKPCCEMAGRKVADKWREQSPHHNRSQ